MKFVLSVLVYLSLRCYRICTRISNNINLKLKIKKLIKTNGIEKLTKGETREIRNFYKKYKTKKVSVLWHRYYTKNNNIFSLKYVPEDIFYEQIEKKLNRIAFVPALEDKNFLIKILPEAKQPKTIVKNVNGFFYVDEDLVGIEEVLRVCGNFGKMIIKPTIETGGGKNVRLFSCKDGITDIEGLSLKDFLASYRKDFIVQEPVKQHPMMAKLNETSLNTIRSMTYFYDNQVVMLSTIVRFGQKGSYLDNSSAGGLCMGVQKDGRLTDQCYQNLSGKKIDTKELGFKVENIVIPILEKVQHKLFQWHKKLPHFKLISWDLAIDKNQDVVLIEYNVSGQEANFHQLNNGPVLAPLLEVLETKS